MNEGQRAWVGSRESFLGGLEEAAPGGEEGVPGGREEPSGERAGGVAWLGPERRQHSATVPATTAGPTVRHFPDLQPCTGDKTQALGSWGLAQGHGGSWDSGAQHLWPGCVWSSSMQRK